MHGCFQLYVHVDSFHSCVILILTFIQRTGLALSRRSSDLSYGYQLG